VATEPRLPPEKLARLYWHNDVSRLILDCNAALAATADDRARDVLIWRSQRGMRSEVNHPSKNAARH
jgi:metallo-beta-lactamase family protein